MRNRRSKLNNAGFSLVELIIAVAVLAFAASPLLYNFVVSARIDKKGRELTAATMAAQNIQETFTASSIDSIKDMSALGGASVISETDEDGNIELKIKDYSVNGQKFDALAVLDVSSYEEYNAESIPTYVSMDAAFNQTSGVSQDSDVLVLADRNKNEIKTRTITIDISNMNTSSSSTTVVGHAQVTYTYELTDGSKIPYEYDLNPDGCTLKAGTKDEMNVYLMFDLWTPDLWDTSNTSAPKTLISKNSKTSTAYETIIINNPSNVPVNVMLVSQSGSDISNNFSIKQYQSKKYDMKDPSCFTYCNAPVKSYRVYTGNAWFTDETIGYEKTAVVSKNTASIYGVTIKLFKAGSNWAGNPIYTFTATKQG